MMLCMMGRTFPSPSPSSMPSPSMALVSSSSDMPECYKGRERGEQVHRLHRVRTTPSGRRGLFKLAWSKRTRQGQPCCVGDTQQSVFGGSAGGMSGRRPLGAPSLLPLTCRSVAFLASPLSVSFRHEVNSCWEVASLPRKEQKNKSHLGFYLFAQDLD